MLFLKETRQYLWLPVCFELKKKKRFSLGTEVASTCSKWCVPPSLLMVLWAEAVAVALWWAGLPAVALPISH